MPNVLFPAFFADSSRTSSRYSVHGSVPPELEENSEVLPVSRTPVMPQQPVLLPEGRRAAAAGPAVLNSGPAIALAAQTVLRSGSLKKRSHKISAVFQPRFVVLEGAPTNVLVYYASKVAHAAEDASNKPRGVIALSVRV